MRDKPSAAPSDRRIAAIAGRQQGVITATQLADIGIDRKGVWRRVRAGRLHRLHRGVFAVGHERISSRGRWLAAVLACGPQAVLSHRSAAALWGIRPSSSRLTEVTVPSIGGRPDRPGILLHATRHLPPEDTTRQDGIPLTCPARTINDLRRVLPPDHLQAAIRRAEVLRLDIGRQPGYVPDHTRSELERRFLALCRRHGLPPPEVNACVGTFYVDFLWPEQLLIVETDGYEHHGTRSAFESDRERDARLHLLGYTVLRFTHRQLTAEPDRAAATVATLLAARPAAGAAR